MSGLLLGAALVAPLQPALAQEIAPKIVLQAADVPEIAAWTPDDRFLVTARAATRELLVWDVASGNILNRIMLPSQGDYVEFAAMRVEGDGRTVLLQAAVVPSQGSNDCRPELYTIDLASGKVAASATTALLDPCAPEDFDRTSAKLPPSHKAKWRLTIVPSADGPTILVRSAREPVAAQGGLPHLAEHPVSEIIQTFAMTPPQSLDAAAMAPDARRLALVDTGFPGADSVLEVFDLPTAKLGKSISFRGEFRAVEWIDDQRILLGSGRDGLARFVTPDIAAPFDETAPPDTVVDAASGATLRELPQRCYTASLGDERFIGAGLANCSQAGRSTDQALQVFENGAWKPFATIAQDGRHLDRIRVSPDRQTVVLVLDRPRGAEGNSLRLIKASDGATIATADFAGRGQINATYAEDGTTLLLATTKERWVWPAGAAKPTPIVLPPGNTAAEYLGILAGDGGQLFHSSIVSDQVMRLDRRTGAALPSLDTNGVLAAGFLPGGKLFWTASKSDGIGLWDRRDWHRVATTYLRYETGEGVPAGFVTVTPDGRFDTDLGPDANQFRWLMADAPFQSLPAQTFMRDYFEPRLLGKLLGCVAADDCATAVPPLPSLASLNRVLPIVAITSVTRRLGLHRGTLNVMVNVREGVNLQAANGKTHSGLYNLRVFRNGRLVAQYLSAESRDGQVRLAETNPSGRSVDKDIAAWRERNLIAQASGGGDSEINLAVEVPTAPGTETATFSAYAFNADRVKSETASLEVTRGELTAAPRRAFVLTIGIDAYDDPSLQLNFAANDARLMAQRLAAVPGYEVRPIDLRAARDTGGKPRRITRELLEAVFGTLAGDDPAVAKQYLTQQGFDGAGLDVAHPDDIVIVTYSGHGYTDPHGSFFLLPSETRMLSPGGLPDPASLFSATDLSHYLSAIKATEIALIIDACHSAASVDANNFKPGPMGDPGLGQLAYDKGIRVLAASQSDDVALESDKLKQGLLTYALANEGLGENGGRADSDGDGRITLDEWLQYGAKRLPALSADLTAGRPIKGARGVALLDGIPAKAQVQQPALFDFTGQPSSVVLKAGQ